MAQSALEVANAALFKLGAVTVTSVTSDTSKEGVAIAARLEPCKRAVIRMHPWNFATKRKVILPPASFAISNVAFDSTQIAEITQASAVFTVGQYVTITGVVGATAANGTFEITGVPDAFTTKVRVPLATTALLLGTYTSGGTIRVSPAFGYSYLYTLPTDCLRRLPPDNDDAALWSCRWKIEGRNLLSDQGTSLPLKYLYDVTDYTLMDISFYECLATYLAWDICDHITGDDAKKRGLWTDLHGGDGKVGLLPRGRFADATEDSLEEIRANTWLSARYGGAGVSGTPAVYLGN